MKRDRTKPPRPPTYGPYATADGKLSPEGSEVVLAFLARFPHPSRLLRYKWPELYHRAVDRCGEEEIDAVCAYGAVDAVLRYTPKASAQFSAYAVWRLRAAVLNELGRTGHKQDERRGNNQAIDFDEVTALLPANDAGDRELLEQRDRSEFFRSEILAAVDRCESCPYKKNAFAFRHGLKDGEWRSLREAGKCLGITSTCLNKIESAVVSKITPELQSLWAEHGPDVD